MLRRLTPFAAALVLTSVFAGPAAGAPPKDEPDPDRRVLVVEKEGEKIGELSYKWVRTASGNEFASSKAELRTGGSRYVIRTHLKRRADGVVEKYKKWIGLEGHRPDVIVFWKENRIRTVSKIPDRKFTRTFDPPESFYIIDELGFHLYRDFVRSWRRDGDGARNVLATRDGRFSEVSVTGWGTALVTRKDKARTVDVVAVELDGQRTLVYADDRDELWGLVAAGLTLTRGGWALGEVMAPVAAPVDDVSAEHPPPSADSVGTSPGEGGGSPSEAEHKPLPID